MNLGDWLSDAPFSLALSAGFFGFYAHAGAIRALEEAHLAPTAVCGASAGAILAAQGTGARLLTGGAP